MESTTHNCLSTCPESFMRLSCQNDALLLPEIILLVLNINFSICSSLNGDTRFVQKLICLCRSNLHCLIKYLSEGLRNCLKIYETPLKMENEDWKGSFPLSQFSYDPLELKNLQKGPTTSSKAST